jgi:hypothetical protein
MKKMRSDAANGPLLIHFEACGKAGFWHIRDTSKQRPLEVISTLIAMHMRDIRKKETGYDACNSDEVGDRAAKQAAPLMMVGGLGMVAVQIAAIASSR